MSVLVNARRFLAQILVNARSGVLVNARGKLPEFTQACGKRRFPASDDSEIGGGIKVQPGAERPLTGR